MLISLDFSFRIDTHRPDTGDDDPGIRRIGGNRYLDETRSGKGGRR